MEVIIYKRTGGHKVDGNLLKKNTIDNLILNGIGRNL
jgi:hypothetical protein